MGREVRALDQWGADQIARMVEANPVRHCLAASRLESGGRGLIRTAYSDLLGFIEDGRVVSGLLLGANVAPIETSGAARREFAAALARHGRRCSSIVGPAAEVHELWAMLKPSWGHARAIRQLQPVMAMSAYSAVPPDDLVRYSTRSDLEALVPACVEMFTGEVGVSPLLHGGGAAYRNRIAELVSSRRSFVRVDGGRITFKAEVGVVGGTVAQVQGVWVAPELRGRGLAVPAMAAVVRKVLDDIAPTVSLYVNDFNTAALATYRRVGFSHVDDFATVLF